MAQEQNKEYLPIEVVYRKADRPTGIIMGEDYKGKLDGVEDGHFLNMFYVVNIDKKGVIVASTSENIGDPTPDISLMDAMNTLKGNMGGRIYAEITTLPQGGFQITKKYGTYIKIFKNVGTFTEDEMYLNMQYYHEYVERNGYITPQEWLAHHKHF